MQYPIVVKPDTEDGGFVVECPAIPGCVSEGDTMEEAMSNIRDAIAGCLAILREKGEPLPQPADAILATVEVAG